MSGVYIFDPQIKFNMMKHMFLQLLPTSRLMYVRFVVKSLKPKKKNYCKLKKKNTNVILTIKELSDNHEMWNPLPFCCF
jgi:hypothetical protein